MRIALATLLLIGLGALTAPALAEGNTPYLGGGNPEAPTPPQLREGGETIEDAVEINTIPFSVTGHTCDNVDDYDEACPYDGSTSPDVVYSLTGPTLQCIEIDLCASLYDTKVYVYDFEGGHGFGNPLACNDDAGCGYSGYQSRIEFLELPANHTYYIVVDGYGGDCGDYVLDIYEFPCGPCVECPAGAIEEGEPPLVDDYVDLYNGGCNSPPDYPFQNLCGDESGYLLFCGHSGNYMFQGSEYRDTDWFILYKGSDPFQIQGVAEWPTYLYQLGFDPIQRCDGSVTVENSVLLEVCTPGVLELAGEIGDEVWFWVGTASWEQYPEYLYVLECRGLGSGHTPVSTTTWGTIKRMFR